MPTTPHPRALDLFCGAGGMSLGLIRAGYDVAAAVDCWQPALDSYRANFPRHTVLGIDLGDRRAETTALTAAGITPGSIDLVVGGPPCQGFSIQRIGADADPRNNLVLRFGEIVSRLQAPTFLMENVPGLLGQRGRALMKAFRQQMAANGYQLAEAVLDAADYGVPQRRRRVIVCGWRPDIVPPVSLPRPTVAPGAFRTVWQAIGDLPPPPSDYSPLAGDALHRRMRLSQRNEERIRRVPPGGGFEHLPVSLRVDCHKNGPERIGHRNVYGRLAADQPAATITARFDSFTRGQFGHPTQHRNISLREGARLQTFPDEHRFLGTQEEIAALIGNAVPPAFAEVLACTLIGRTEGCSTPPTSGGRSMPPELPLFSTNSAHRGAAQQS